MCVLSNESFFFEMMIQSDCTFYTLFFCSWFCHGPSFGFLVFDLNSRLFTAKAPKLLHNFGPILNCTFKKCNAQEKIQWNTPLFSTKSNNTWGYGIQLNLFTKSFFSKEKFNHFGYYSLTNVNKFSSFWHENGKCEYNLWFSA